jgi:hypothetical protein
MRARSIIDESLSKASNDLSNDSICLNVKKENSNVKRIKESESSGIGEYSTGREDTGEEQCNNSVSVGGEFSEHTGEGSTSVGKKGVHVRKACSTNVYTRKTDTVKESDV